MSNLSSEQIEKRIKELMIERLNLKITPENIISDAPIFLGSEVEGSKKGLGLDSIDALELVVGLNNEFGITITDDDMFIFENVNKITKFIHEKQQAQ